jgi:hypothetical protein
MSNLDPGPERVGIRNNANCGGCGNELNSVVECGVTFFFQASSRIIHPLKIGEYPATELFDRFVVNTVI